MQDGALPHVSLRFETDNEDLMKSSRAISPDDDDRDGHRNVGILRTPNAADSPRRLYQVYSPRKHQDLY